MNALISKLKQAFSFSFYLLFVFLISATIGLASRPVFAIPNPSTTEVENSETAPSTSPRPTPPSPSTTDNPDSASTTSPEDPHKPKDACQASLGAISWLVCPTTGVISTATDKLYKVLERFLVVNPIETKNGSPIYELWKYCRGLTNLVFIIFLLIIIYSQITGLGISNYGIKKSLPKLIVMAILVNLSFIICSLAVDVSNIVGSSLRGIFTSIETASLSTTTSPTKVSTSSIFLALTGSSALTIGGAVLAFETGAIWMLIPVALGAIAAVVTGLITIALRQAVVTLLVMISPLAFVAYILPNTEHLFRKWKELLYKMLVFYPMFSLLMGASNLAGWAIITSAKDGFAVILGIAVQIFPLFFSWKLMRMSGTFLGAINDRLRNLASRPVSSSRAWAEGMRAQTRAKHLRDNKLPYSKLQNYLAYRRGLTEYNTNKMTDERNADLSRRVLEKATSYKGRGKDGLDQFENSPNKYTVNAKRASLAELRAKTAASRLNNATSTYGTTFKNDAAAKALGAKTGDAFKDFAAQEFLTVNNAQADEDFLFGAYTSAVNSRFRNPYEYNRLVKNAAGDLGLLGESSIMGQAIQKNAKTEARRRAEALIMISKFGYDRAAFHSAATGVFRNEDGYAIDRVGNVIEDSTFRLKPGKTYVKWDKYEVDPITGKSVAYFDMTNDAGELVQRVYMNDNGYMKELLTDDIMIGDPVNRLYEMSAGIGGDPAENPLRKYYSTIAKNITVWKDHSGGSTPMLAAMIRNGTLNSRGKYTIGYLQSLKAATKASAFLTNDKFIINDLNKVFVAANPELFMTADGKFSSEAAKFLGLPADSPWVPFEYYIPDQDINDYLDVKKTQLGGLRLDPATNKWQSVEFNDPSLTFEDKKNFVIHDLVPGTIKKLFGLTNRNLSPNLLENQKPPTAEALSNMLEIFNIIGQHDPSIYNTTDPSVLKRLAEQAKKNAADFRHRGNDPYSARNYSGSFVSLSDQIARAKRTRDLRAEQDSPTRAVEEIADILNSDCDIDELCSTILNILDHSPSLDPYLRQSIKNIIDENQYSSPTSSDDAAHGFTHFYEDEDARSAKIRSEIASQLGLD